MSRLISIVIVILLVFIGNSRASYVPGPDLFGLVSGADVIVVGRLAPKPESPALEETRFFQTISVDKVIKGAKISRGERISVDGHQLGSRARVWAETYGIWFLHLKPSGRLVFVDPQIAGLPAAPLRLFDNQSIALDKSYLIESAAEIANVLTLPRLYAGDGSFGVAAPIKIIGTPVAQANGHDTLWERRPSRNELSDATYGEATHILMNLADSIRVPLFEHVYRGVDRHDGSIWSAGALVALGDLRSLPAVVSFLVDPANDNSVASVALYRDISSVQPENGSLRDLEPLLRARSLATRRAGAEAISQVDRPDIPDVITALLDNADEEIKLSAIRSICAKLDGCAGHTVEYLSSPSGIRDMKTTIARRNERP